MKTDKQTSCGFWHPPVCQKYKSETGCTFGNTCFFRHVEAEEKPSKKSKKVCAKGSVALMKEFIQLGCVFEDSYPRQSILRQQGKLGSKHAVKFSKGTWHQIKYRERKGPSRGIIQRCESHERRLCAPKFEERSHEETLHQERCARGVAWNLAKIFTSSIMRTKLRFILLSKPGQCRRPLRKRPEENIS